MTAIKVPPLGESIVEATISRWLKKEGDAVAPGESLVELETDKITVDVPAMSTGVLSKRLKNEGDVVHVDDVLCEIQEGAGTAATPPAASPAKPPEAPKPTETPKPAAAAMTAGEPRVSPAAARTAADRGIDAAAVTGTGRGGVVSKADVIGAAEKAPAPSGASAAPPAKEQQAPPRPTTPLPQASGERETREKMSTRRKRIAEHLLESQHATAHLTTFNEIDMTAVNALRERHKERVEKEAGVKLSLMPFFVKAACAALKTYPTVNAQLDGDSIIYKHYVNMGIAVASDAGLVVPNVKDADRKGMIDLAKEIALVAKRARDGKLTMDDLTGGTFTITNGGVFGSLVSTPIINYPQVGILGLHKTQDRPVAIAGKVEIRPMMYVALSYDHRIIDGQQAVLFLVRVKELMEDPAAMLIG
jgi:2-oxoglutarate dehydrogenase E2 component (dihydrolipoamide succinyltransferase)